MANEKETINIKRDEKGNIVEIECPDDLLDTVPSMIFLADIKKVLQDFDKNTAKYSKRMERMTVAIIALTIVQLMITIITIYLTFFR